jgi:hypothetical protein
VQPVRAGALASGRLLAETPANACIAGPLSGLPPTLSIACMHMAASPSLEVFKRRIGRACIVPLFRAKQMSSVPPAWAR